MSAPRPRFAWNEASGQYRDLRTGRFVSADQVRAAHEAVVTASRAHMQALTVGLRDGSISLADWQREMMHEIKQGHLAAAAAQRGGWSQMTQADFGRVGQIVRSEYAALNRFAAQMAVGLPPNAGRAAQYAGAARTTAATFERLELQSRGKTEEQNVLGPNEPHCETEGDRIGCVEVTRRGWVPIGTLPLPGKRRCYAQCKCHLEYR